MGSELSADEQVALDVYLQEMVLESPDVKAFLTDLASLAAASIADVDPEMLCGVTVIRRKKPVTVAGNNDTAYRFDQLQNSFGDGPCLTAMREMKSLLVPDLHREPRWPDFIQALSDQGINSVLGVPLLIEGETRASLNFYASRAQAFTHADVERAESFAAHASKSLRLSLKIAHYSEARDDLAAAMESRTIIDLALGAVMAQNRCSQDEARRILTAASNHRNEKLRDIAAAVIASISDSAVSTNFDIH